MSQHKIVLALNKRNEANKQLLALAAVEVAFRLGLKADAHAQTCINFLDYRDANGNAHSPISALSLVVMRGKSGELNKLAQGASEHAIMGEAVGALDLIPQEPAKVADADEGLLAVAVLGGAEALAPLTRRLSVWS